MKGLLKSLVLNPFLLKTLSRVSTQPGIRRRIASYRFLRGYGLEIGALHNPLAVSAAARVRYVDRAPPGGLEKHYWWLKSKRIARVDIVDDGAELPSIINGSQDFVIANHVFEHLENPLLALRNWVRVIRIGGVIFLCVPNRNETFDRRRPVTSFEHLLVDLRNGPEVSRLQHYLEWVTGVGDMIGREAEVHARHLMETRHSIHFHCWDPSALLQLLVNCQVQLALPVQVELFEAQGNEMLVVIRKVDKVPAEQKH